MKSLTISIVMENAHQQQVMMEPSEGLTIDEAFFLWHSARALIVDRLATVLRITPKQAEQRIKLWEKNAGHGHRDTLVATGDPGTVYRLQCDLCKKELALASKDIASVRFCPFCGDPKGDQKEIR